MPMFRSALAAGLFAATSLTVGTFAAAPAPVSAQNTLDQFEVSFQNREAQRRAAISTGMNFSEEEAMTFWPIYDQYRIVAKGHQLKRLLMMRSLADNTVGMEETLASTLITQSLKLEADQDDAKQAFFEELDTHFEGARHFRIYQLETKLDAIFDFGWTNQIPFAVTEEEMAMLQHGLEVRKAKEEAARPKGPTT